MAEPDGRRETLLALRAEARERWESASWALGALVRERETVIDDDEHDPDGATLSAEWSRLTGLAQAARSKLEQVTAALDRLDDGTYGTCARCGEPIPAGRLEARPFAAHCVSCAERLER